MRRYGLVKAGDRFRPVLQEADPPFPAPNEVLIRFTAWSLNYRDLLMLDGRARVGRDGLVPLSDGVGRIEAIGTNVTGWAVGDRVVPNFFSDWTRGRFESRYITSALGGGDRDGVLTEFAAFDKDAVVAVPPNLSDVQAATLPCAALTGYQALFLRSKLEGDDTLLVQGTGGVALFGVQFAHAVGANVIVISSSNEKLERLQRLGPMMTINYREHPDWDKEVLRLTAGRGATHILELGGRDTFQRSIAALAAAGTIAQIGVLTGFDLKPNLLRLRGLNASIIGISVGSAENFAALNAFVAQKNIVPVIDREFAFDDAPAAFEHLAAAGHLGKVVISI